MVLFDLLSRRSAMGVLRHLDEVPRTFHDLQARYGSVSPSMLNARLKELREVGLIEKVKGGYALTTTGRDLFDRLEPLGDWAMGWAPTL